MPLEEWDLVVIGTGAAGLVAGHIAGGIGLKVACVEADRVGGECSWTGCVPSKALLHCARECWRLTRGERAGLRYDAPRVDTSGVLEHVRRLRAEMALGLNENALRERGIHLVAGPAHVEPGPVVRVGERTLSARHVLISTGSRAVVPPIPGLREAGYLTNRELFELPEPPPSMVIIGAGPIGVEMAQAFRRLGTQVTVVEQHGEILPRDDPEHAGRLLEVLESEGTKFVLCARAVRVERVQDVRRVTVSLNGDERVVEGRELLIAAGRAPNVEGLGLKESGVKFGEHGIAVDAHMRTTERGIWAAGDVTGTWQFSHMAEYEATIAMRNALIGAPQSATYRDAGWCTFTDPELASCGLQERDARRLGLRHAVYRWGFAQDDRARVDDAATGEVKIVAHPTSGRVYGAQILGPRAGELLQEFLIALAHGLPLRKLSRVVHIYPALTVATQRAGQMWWQRRLQTGWPSRLLGRYLRLRGFRGRS